MQRKKRRSDRCDDHVFLAINASGLTLIPTSVMAFWLAGAANPTDVFLPILIATTASTLTAIWIVGFRQRINLFRGFMPDFLRSSSFYLIGLLIAAGSA